MLGPDRHHAPCAEQPICKQQSDDSLQRQRESMSPQVSSRIVLNITHFQLHHPLQIMEYYGIAGTQKWVQLGYESVSTHVKNLSVIDYKHCRGNARGVQSLTITEGHFFFVAFLCRLLHRCLAGVLLHQAPEALSAGRVTLADIPSAPVVYCPCHAQLKLLLCFCVHTRVYLENLPSKMLGNCRWILSVLICSCCRQLMMKL